MQLPKLACRTLAVFGIADLSAACDNRSNLSHCARMRYERTVRAGRLWATLLASITVTLVGLSCSNPTELPAPDQEWVLVAVGGSPLPARVSQDVEIIGGTLHLSNDATYTRLTQATVTQVEFHFLETGHWTATTGQVEMRPLDGSEPVVADWRDGAIEIPGALKTKYIPASAVPRAPGTGPSLLPSQPPGTPNPRRPRYDVSAPWSASASPVLYWLRAHRIP